MKKNKKRNLDKKYGIKITYSWGDEEPIDQLPYFDTKEEAYKEICKLAGKEAYVENEEFLPENGCKVEFDAAAYMATLTYYKDDTTCTYRVADLTNPEFYIPMDEGRAKEILCNLVQLVGAGNDEAEQIKKLLEYGFTGDELVYEFGLDAEAVENVTGEKIHPCL